MKIETAIKKAREREGLTQSQVGKILNYSRQQVSGMENSNKNKRKLGIEDFEKYLKNLDDPVLYLQAINYITDKTYGLEEIKEDEDHPAAQYFKFNVAVQEIIQLINSYPLVDKNVDKNNVTEVLEGLVNLTNAAMRFAAVVSRFYNIKIPKIKSSKNKL